MSRPLLLIPSSKAKLEDGEGPAYARSASLACDPLAGPRREVLAALASAADGLDDRGVARLCGVRPDDAGAQRTWLAGLADAPTEPAGRRYTGVVHRFADLGTVDPSGVEVDLATFSGLLGIAMLDDPVPDYRLEVTGRVPELGVLGTWWRRQLGEHLRELGADRRVWDLLPGEFARLWPDAERGDVEVVRVAFRRPDDGRAAPTASAKVAKGRLLRVLVDRPDLAPDDLVGSDAVPEWSFEPDEHGLVAVQTG